jgi:Gas vesicle synthesis protein GvpL/GvpF
VGQLLVYGVVPAGSLPRVDAPGVEGARVSEIETGALAALAGPVSDVPVRTTRAHLSAYRDVLAEAADRTTVVPARFGTVMTEGAVREELLERRRDDLMALLERLEGKVELSVKAVYDEELLLREVVAASPDVGVLRTRTRKLTPEAGYYDRIRLGEIVAAGVEQRRAADAARIVEGLRPHAADVSTGEALVDRVAVQAAFLVERKLLSRFDAELERLAAAVAPRLTLRCVGPLPPYSFAELPARQGVAA